MKKALAYIKGVSKADEILDFEQMYSVDVSDAKEAARIAYNEALDKAAEIVGNYCEREMIDKRDIVRSVLILKQ